jgi:hypothetical protein
MKVPAAFLSGKLVDENGLAPRTACFTVVTEGNLHGRHGFVRIDSDLELSADGAFTSPPLSPGRYFLRFFGMLQSVSSSSAAAVDPQQHRVFDFIYPCAVNVSEALPFDLQAGETMSSVFQVPKPVWFNVAGRVTGNLADQHQRISILFQRDMGILDGVGGYGFGVRVDKRFEGMLLKGAYRASIHEMTDQEPSGYTRSIRQFGSMAVVIERDVLNPELPIE